MARTITSTDAIFALVIPGVFGSPQIIQGWSADDMFDLDACSKVETMFGIDGHLSLGYVKKPRKMKLKFNADSPSLQVFDAWASAMDATTNAIPCDAYVTMIANGAEYIMLNGGLTSYKDMPDAKKLLQPITLEITWESVTKTQV